MSMTIDEQRIAVAEWCGWRLVDDKATGRCPDFNDDAYSVYGNSIIPDYANDLNAMREAELKLDGRKDYYERLTWICDHTWQHSPVKMPRSPISATAAQRLEALCRTLWPERWEK